MKFFDDQRKQKHAECFGREQLEFELGLILTADHGGEVAHIKRRISPVGFCRVIYFEVAGHWRN